MTERTAEAMNKNSEFSHNCTSEITRMHPDTEVGDRVQIKRNTGISATERPSHWLKKAQTVKRIANKVGHHHCLENDDGGCLRRV